METKETIKVLQRMVDKSDGDEFIALRSAIDAVLQVKAFEEGGLVHVVRCKECKWQGKHWENGTVSCGSDLGMISAPDDGYCSCGRRI